MTRIITHNTYPPIPIRNHDWIAYPDGAEEDGPFGHGRTEQEAIDDLREQMDGCPMCSGPLIQDYRYCNACGDFV